MSYLFYITLSSISELRPPIFGCDQPFGRWAFTSTAAPSTTTSASQTAALWHIARVANERSVGQISGAPVSGYFHVRTVLVRPNSESTATHCFFGPCGTSVSQSPLCHQKMKNNHTVFRLKAIGAIACRPTIACRPERHIASQSRRQRGPVCFPALLPSRTELLLN